MPGFGMWALGFLILCNLHSLLTASRAPDLWLGVQAAANKALDRIDNEKRLAELEAKERRKAEEKEELENGVARELREEYLKLAMQQDEEREAKYKTLDDYSDSIERELEELREAVGLPLNNSPLVTPLSPPRFRALLHS